MVTRPVVENTYTGSSILMAGMGVVATQHIREEYDEEEDCYDDEEEEDEEEEEYGELQIGIIEETPPVVEGGDPSSGVLNTNGNVLAVAEVNLTSGG